MISLLIITTAYSAIGKFLHLTDIHYDPLYEPGSPSKCILGNTGLGCCHKYDIPLKNSTPASVWGDYNCDTSKLFVDETLHWINNNIPSIDYILYTGDSAGHHDITNTPAIIKNSLSDIDYLFKYHFPKIPVYNNLGNHDTWPIDQTTPIEYNSILKYVSNLWANNVDSMSVENIEHGGYYSIMLNNFTRLVSFNSIYYDGHNLFKHKKNLYNDSQVMWLKTILDKSRLYGQQVWFISHIFPSAGESTREYNAIMKQIFWDYRDVIRYQWWGHSHNDQFILYQHTDYLTNISTIHSSGMVGPSIMPDKRFPAFRIYEYDTDTFSLIDYTQYVANLSEIISNNAMHYHIHYSFKKTYNLSGLETSDYIELYNGIINGSYSQLYNSYYTPGMKTTQMHPILV